MREEQIEIITKQDIYSLLQNNPNGLTIDELCQELNQYDDSQVSKILRIEKKLFWAIDGIHWCTRDSYSPEEESKIIAKNLYNALRNLPNGHTFNSLVSMFPSFGKIQIKQVLKKYNNVFVSCGTRWGIKDVFTYCDDVGVIIRKQEKHLSELCEEIFKAISYCQCSQEIKNQIKKSPESKNKLLLSRWKKITTNSYFPSPKRIVFDEWYETILLPERSFETIYKRAVGLSFHFNPNSISSSHWLKIILLDEATWDRFKAIINNFDFPRLEEETFEFILEVTRCDEKSFDNIKQRANVLQTLIGKNSLLYNDWLNMISLDVLKWSNLERNLTSIEIKTSYPKLSLLKLSQDDYRYIVDSLQVSQSLFLRKKSKILRILKSADDRRKGIGYRKEHWGFDDFDYESLLVKNKEITESKKTMPKDSICVGNCSTCNRDSCPWDNRD